jgi:cyclase
MRNWLPRGLVAAFLAATTIGFAQTPPASHFHVHQLSPRVYWVDGNGNSGFIVGDKGVVVFDAKMTASLGKELLETIAKITPKPVSAVILSHSDLDHVGGVAAFPKGIPVIAHQNMRKELEADPTDGGHGYLAPENLPNRLVTQNKEDLVIDGIKLELLHWGPAHTSGDLVLYLPEERIVFAADMLCLDFPGPLVHIEKNGTARGWLDTFRGMANLDADTFVPGHGEIQNKKSLQGMLNSAETEYRQVKELVAQGKTLEQIEAAVNDPPRGPEAAKYRMDFPTFSQVVYRELTNPVAKPGVSPTLTEFSRNPTKSD